MGSIGQGSIQEIAITLQLMFLIPSCNLIRSLAGSLHLQAFTIIKFHRVEAVVGDPLISHNKIKAKRIATARTRDASSFTVNASLVVNTAKTVIAMAAVTT